MIFRPGDEVEVQIDVPKGGFVKRLDDGRVDFYSPFPSPFNYGHVVDALAADGQNIDAVVLGDRVPSNTLVTTRVRARLGFIDSGTHDEKLICANWPLSERESRKIERFFRVYAVAKKLLARVRNDPGQIRYVGWL